MMMKSSRESYEVICRLPDTGEICHYRCRGLSDQQEYHLVQIRVSRLEAGSLALLTDFLENPAFEDLTECFTVEEKMHLVLPFPSGKNLKECMQQEPVWPGERRFLAGQHLIERMILLQIPPWMQAELADPAWIYPEEEPVGWLYPFSAIENLEAGSKTAAWGNLVYGLFEPEIASGLYPEIQVLAEDINAMEAADLMEVYAQYLKLLPICSQKREEGSQEEVPSPKIKNIKKLLALAAVLIAAAMTLPNLWKDKISPVVEAVALWKAIYVDGEKPEEESEAETEPESEAASDTDGSVTWYWEDKTLCYEGAIADGKPEGKGTSYYPGGLMEYQGEFSFGKRNGEGSFYTEEGVLQYEGGFYKDMYDGMGRLYDEKNGNLIYEGEFSRGKYSGKGVLFDPWSEFPLYDGTFRLGYYDGEGIEYDSNGAPRYEGGFLLGIYHGHGTYYDASTGEVMMEGAFRNGNLVLSAETASDSNGWEQREGDAEYEGKYDSGMAPEAG